MTQSPSKDFLELRAHERQALQAKLSALLANKRQAILELGCGHGHFLASLAAADPQGLYIGIDKLPSRIARAQRKAQHASVDRLHFIHADILDFLEFSPPSLRWDGIYILFPDPWPKRRHHKHRWLQAPTLKLLARQALPSAQLFFRTDVKSFFEDVVKLIQAEASWELVCDAPWPVAAPTVFERYASAHYSLVAKPRAYSL